MESIVGYIATTQRRIEMIGTPTLVWITPKDAARMLAGMESNRLKSPPHIAKLARDMKGGNWKVNGETIKLDHREKVIDGQHRLLACIQAGVSFQTWVISGVPNEV